MTITTKMNQQTKKIAIYFLAIGILASAVLFWRAAAKENAYLEAYFFDVGQGDAILFKKGNKEILIDGGPDAVIVEKLSEVLGFFDQKIEIIILSHPHADHITGLLEILQYFEVGKIIATKVGYDSAVYDAFWQEAEKRKIPVVIAQEGVTLEWGDSMAEILFPFENLSSVSTKDPNNTSVVFLLHYGEIDFLLPGDLEKKGERELIAHYDNLRSEVLKIGHQGSKTSTTEEFLSAIQPQVAVISVGKNPYGHPHQETLDKLSGLKLYRTDQDGDVHLITDGKNLYRKQFKIQKAKVKSAS